jgi:hypothetical protein
MGPSRASQFVGCEAEVLVEKPAQVPTGHADPPGQVDLGPSSSTPLMISCTARHTSSAPFHDASPTVRYRRQRTQARKLAASAAAAS